MSIFGDLGGGIFSGIGGILGSLGFGANSDVLDQQKKLQEQYEEEKLKTEKQRKELHTQTIKSMRANGMGNWETGDLSESDDYATSGEPNSNSSTWGKGNNKTVQSTDNNIG